MNINNYVIALAVSFAATANAQQNYETGNPADNANYGYLQHYKPLKQYVDREKYPNFKLGLAVTAREYIDGGNVKAVANGYFDETVTGNAMKMAGCVRSDGTMDFNTVRQFVGAASASGQNIYGHTLAWHAQQATAYLNALIKDRKADKVDGDTVVWSVQALKDFVKTPSVGWNTSGTADYGYTLTFNSDGLLVHTTKKTPNFWDVQYIVMENIPTEKGETYKLTMTVKGSAKGVIHSKLGDWSGGPGAEIPFGTEWQDVEVTYKNTLANSFLLLQNGDFVGDIQIKSIKIEQSVSCNKVAEPDRRCVAMKVGRRQSEVWDNQLWLVAGDFSKGDRYEFSAEVRADIPSKASTQIHKAPGTYADWQALGDIDFSTRWATVSKSGTFAAAGQSVAFNMSEFAEANTYYLDNISLKVNGVERLANGNFQTDDVSSFVWKLNSGRVVPVTVANGIAYAQIPADIPLTPQEKHDTLVYAMNRWIGGIMQACGGKVKAWDVVNEAISGGGADSEGVFALQHGNGSNANDFFWQDHMGDLEYVRQAVRLARKHYAESMARQGGDDGKLKLFVNDYNLESDWDNNGKLKSLIKWIERWEADGVTHIDGIGSQMHISCYANENTNNSKKRAIENSFRLMAATGKLVRISELDMGMEGSGGPVAIADMTEDMHHKMADLYEWIVKKYLEIIPASQQWGICQWCATDSPAGSGWRADTPVGLWTLNFYRKHTYGGVARGLGAPADPTSIDDIDAGSHGKPMPVFDLTGRYVGTSTKALQAGVYISGGREIVLKR